MIDVKMNVMIDMLHNVFMFSFYSCGSSILLLITYACLSSLYWSAVATLDRVRDYLGQVDKS